MVVASGKQTFGVCVSAGAALGREWYDGDEGGSGAFIGVKGAS